MKLADKISINTHYTRSTNIERDRDSQAIVKAYLPTSRGVEVLNEVAVALGNQNQPRAWSLIGPYGSGKSSFALFLNHLLGESSSPIGKTALRVMDNDHEALANQFKQQSQWCRVMLTGSAEPLSARLLNALNTAGTEFWGNKRGRKPSVLKNIRAACNSTPTTNDVLQLVDELQEAIESSGGGGLLIVIDELGKFLEYEARNYGANDIFLLQGLAERAYSGRQANLLLFVLLHQSFEMYARGLSQNLKNEWAKVQGRFQTIPFIETIEQTLRVVAAAFDNSLTENQKTKLAKKARLVTKKTTAGKIDSDVATKLFAACYPLHPVTLLVLITLCQKFAQNERTLFTYLGSLEPHGLRHSLDNLNLGQRIYPDKVYDYFIQNQSAVLSDPLTHRRWVEVITAVERAEELGKQQQAIAKSIGLLNLVSGTEGLKASPDILSTLFRMGNEVKTILRPLVDASIIQYRKFNDEYRVWQGTDFDINEAVQLEIEKRGRFELASTLLERTEPVPFLARRLSIRSSTLRYLPISYVDALTYRQQPESMATPRILFFLAEGKDDENIFLSHLQNKDTHKHTDDNIWVLYRNGTDIRAAIEESLALEGVQRGAQELASDPIASRELRERLKAALVTEQSVLNALTATPGLSDWYWRGNKLPVNNRRALQQQLSLVMEKVYQDAPIINNELINRDRLSSQAAMARNKLFLRMLNNEDEAGLAIEKYPPERSIYRSIFEAGKLHVSSDTGWQFIAPDDSNPVNLKPLWKLFSEFFQHTEAEPLPVSELLEMVLLPPIGLKSGVFPILFLHYYLVHKSEIAVYDTGRYTPELSYEHLERLVRHPEQFSFQRFRIAGLRVELFEEYSKALFGGPKDIDILSIARPLSTFMLGLDEHTQKTRRLTATTLKVRQAFFLAKSPEKLLLKELPKVCGFDNTKDFSGFAECLTTSLRELKQVPQCLLADMQVALGNLFGILQYSSLSELRSLLEKRCSGLDRYTVDVKGLKSFIRRIVDGASTDDQWLSGLLMFLGHKPVTKWTDDDRDLAEYRLSEFALRIMDLEKLRLHHESMTQSENDIDVILLKSLCKGDKEIEEIVFLNNATKTAIQDSYDKVEQLIGELNDNELALALIAKLTHEFLADYRRSQIIAEENRTAEGLKDAG